MFPYDDWKELDVKLMVPRSRIENIRKALDTVNVTVDWDTIYEDKCQLIASVRPDYDVSSLSSKAHHKLSHVIEAQPI